MDKTVELPSEYVRAIQLADLIIYSVKKSLRHGSGNQVASNIPTVFVPESKEQKAVISAYPATHLVREARALKKELYALPVRPNSGPHHPMRGAIAALEVGAGNCGEMADLAYVLCREYFSSEWRVMRASAPKPADHGFCLVWKGEEPESIIRYVNGKPLKTIAIIAVDAWPIYSQAVLWNDHFMSSRTLKRSTWRTTGLISPPKAEKNCIGSAAPKQAALHSMSELIKGLRAGNRIEATLKSRHVLIARRAQERFEFSDTFRTSLREASVAKIKAEKPPAKQLEHLWATHGDITIEYRERNVRLREDEVEPDNQSQTKKARVSGEEA
ncbi:MULTISPECIES: hypothetical protein [Pseudomonas]|jgi:hypothetical protein|uniref:hypothetical protein n=1 Tax=Pseudomonas TaxID=286 RepID=UPI000876E6FE|nr:MULTISPECIES: hypothetical protein [Pseudomonas]SCZ29912.1 hypothetical protein SAMN03159313_2854 [Pseudomonas sp. NFIX46]SDB26554.1 hypothetical protein SAMN03097715_02000 [Pseudomonas putida]SFQ93153.1 hypothetical protein SAMN03159312_5388 [Pseudomonas sp. NFIX49]